MKGHIFLTLLAIGAVSSAVKARANTFADADYFGTKTGGPNGNPSGITLTAGGGSASTSTTFDFVNADGTASFTIHLPYAPAQVRGTYSSQLGFNVGVDYVADGSVTLFLRDPAGGNETLVYRSALASQSIDHGSFLTQLVISEN